MNKLVKGSIAGAAGIALLLGGAGTLALWNTTSDIGTASTISAGTLAITSSTPGTWSDSTGPVNLATYLVVPGDTLTFSQSLEVTATGDTLTADLTLDAASIVAATPLDTEDLALAAALTDSATISVGGNTPAATQSISALAGTQTVDVVVTITFPAGDATTTTYNTAQDGHVTLGNLTLSLTQS